MPTSHGLWSRSSPRRRAKEGLLRSWNRLHLPDPLGLPQTTGGETPPRMISTSPSSLQALQPEPRQLYGLLDTMAAGVSMAMVVMATMTMMLARLIIAIRSMAPPSEPEKALPHQGVFKRSQFPDEWKKATVGTLSGALLDLSDEPPPANGEPDQTWWETPSKRRGSMSSRPRKAEAFEGEYDDTNGKHIPQEPANNPRVPRIVLTEPTL